jgi:hypothetical protein
MKEILWQYGALEIEEKASGRTYIMGKQGLGLYGDELLSLLRKTHTQTKTKQKTAYR